MLKLNVDTSFYSILAVMSQFFNSKARREDARPPAISETIHLIISQYCCVFVFVNSIVCLEKYIFKKRCLPGFLFPADVVQGKQPGTRGLQSLFPFPGYFYHLRGK